MHLQNDKRMARMTLNCMLIVVVDNGGPAAGNAKEFVSCPGQLSMSVKLNCKQKLPISCYPRVIPCR